MLKKNISFENKTVLVTGAAGFIGSNLVTHLFRNFTDIKVIGIDSMTDYYDVNLKKERLKKIEALNRNWIFTQDSIANKTCIDNIFTQYKPNVVVNLAAQAGVRHSITNLHREQHHRILQYTRGLSSSYRGALGLCQQQ